MSEPVEADAVVLAGDIDLGIRGLEWAAKTFPNLPVIYIAGNHEFYGHSSPKIDKAMRETARALGIHFLANDAVILDDVRFLGATLWTDFEIMGHRESAIEVAKTRMRDYAKIRIDPQYRKLRPSDTLGWHRLSKRWLEERLQEPFAGPTVIVTHHAPSATSLDPRFPSDDVNAAYASDLDAMIESSAAKFWIHGHTHFNVDYRIGQTRVITNQRGYVDTPDETFDPSLVLEV
jgi:predicted phosphohydrolase